MGDFGKIGMINWILLGLTMLIPGLLKIFVMGPAAVTDMMSGIALFAWAPAFWAWVVIIAEILAGALILARWKVDKIAWIPVVILVVATFTVHLGNYGNMLVHLTLASNYLLLTCGACGSGKKKK